MLPGIDGIIMFILGGFVSAILFYPRKQNTKELEIWLSLQFYSGVMMGQQDKKLPPIKDIHHAYMIALSNHALFKDTAEDTLKRMEGKV